jgi:hypothetical protein
MKFVIFFKWKPTYAIVWNSRSISVEAINQAVVQKLVYSLRVDVWYK